jgi:hypothetical protein
MKTAEKKRRKGVKRKEKKKGKDKRRKRNKIQSKTSLIN